MPSSEVMHKWGENHLHSGSKHGKKVKSQKQAVAIMLSEKRKEEKGLKAGFSGVVEPPFPAEPVHKGLARGALLKAAKGYREGTMGAKDFNEHIKRAHSRLQEPMGMAAMPMPSVVPQRHTHKKARVKKGSN